jgi:cystathionine beta-lyase/cystathionine gamma-synthase
VKKMKMSSQAIHGGAHIQSSNLPEAMPIYQTSVFTFDDLNHLEGYFSPGSGSYLYSRNKNPNQVALEEVLALLEGAEAAVITSSGMAAISSGLLTFAKAGDHILCSSEIYGVTGVLIEKELARLGIECSFASFSDLDQVREGIRANTSVLLTEVVTNPLLTVIDIPTLAKLAHDHGAKLVVDNTFTSPYVIKPLDFGADIVIHSATKYLNGHNDVTAGVVLADEKTIQRTREVVVTMGCNLGPFEAWLVQRGLKTFGLRLRQHCENGLKVAQFLSNHPKIEKVYYPGLPTHPTYSVGQAILAGNYGGMVSFKITDDLERINSFLRALRWLDIAPSLAGVATTLSHPLKTSHRAWSPEKQQEWGITMGLLRLSVGVEDVEDIIEELGQALEKL